MSRKTSTKAKTYIPNLKNWVLRPKCKTINLKIISIDICICSVKWWAHLGSNQGPTGYEPVALPN